MPAIQSYGTRPLYREQQHPLQASPEFQTQVFQDVYNKTRQGSMINMPYAFEMLRRSGRKLDPQQRRMANIFHTYMNAPRGSKAYLKSLSQASQRWHPSQYLNALNRAGMGHLLRPENARYLSAMAAQDNRLKDWRTMGSASHLTREARRRNLKPWEFLGGLPAFEWQRYNRAGSLGLQRLRNDYRRAVQQSRLPQNRNVMGMLKKWLRGGGDLSDIISTALSNIGLGDVINA